MAISGLVVTLVNDSTGESALARLASDPRLTLGSRFGHRVAVVAETPGVGDDRALMDDLRDTPGIAAVDVTFVHLDESPASGPDRPVTPLERSHDHA